MATAITHGPRLDVFHHSLAIGRALFPNAGGQALLDLLVEFLFQRLDGAEAGGTGVAEEALRALSECRMYDDGVIIGHTRIALRNIGKAPRLPARDLRVFEPLATASKVVMPR